MKRGISFMIVLTLLLSLALAAGSFAQVTQNKKARLDRVEGLVKSIDRSKSTFSIQQTDTSKVLWQVTFDQNTKFTYRNSSSSVSDLKEGQRVVCLGKAGTTGKLAAARVDVRSK